jgi:hypothetical protein
MSQTGYTPIQLYRSTTTSAVPIAGNLSAGELAINLVDEKLYFKNNAGTVKLLAANVTPVANGGTALTATPANGQIPIGNGTGYTLATLTAGSGISISNTSGGITITNAGSGGTVTSVAGTGSANGLTLTGTVTSSGSITLGGSVTSLTTTNFTVQESGGKLIVKYGATTILSISSTGALIAANNITAYGTP